MNRVYMWQCPEICDVQQHTPTMDENVIVYLIKKNFN